ncbi:hypothetical protein [Paracoccus sp. TOH]|uniref:hypothetical protein n=1 Tax=Paracoccus sp. TOH TaxID=1263728 RepID=UPI0025AF9167|nr:hypothetical protein [Paracoccus sp. TOH]WJS85598.1 hypothetical protein NBE95_15690 [Paracoccus sp. TOH]
MKQIGTLLASLGIAVATTVILPNTAAAQRSFHEAVASLKPYVAAGRLRVFTDNASPIPGFGSILRPAHTTRHSSIVVESRGDTFVVWGDIIHGDAVQFDEPNTAIDFDVYSPVATVTRREALIHVAEHGTGLPVQTCRSRASAMFEPATTSSIGCL